LKVGLVGAGGMGANHARVISEARFAELAVVVDLDLDRAAMLARQHGASASNAIDALASCDAAIVATATRAHAEIAISLLGRGLPLLVEKPLAASMKDVTRIVEASRAADVPLMCGFVERHNPAFTTVLDRLDAPVIQVNAVRHSPRNPFAWASVVQDLLIHDIDLALRLAAPGADAQIHGGTWRPQDGARSEIAECILTFDDGMLANLSASRWGQRKVRELRIATEEQVFEIDLLRVTVTAYRNISQSTPAGDLRDLRTETIIDVPYVRHRGEPLLLQLQAFVDLVRDGDASAAELARRQIVPAHRFAEVLELH
jgi:predicted dehydrogenase